MRQCTGHVCTCFAGTRMCGYLYESYTMYIVDKNFTKINQELHKWLWAILTTINPIYTPLCTKFCEHLRVCFIFMLHMEVVSIVRRSRYKALHSTSLFIHIVANLWLNLSSSLSLELLQNEHVPVLEDIEEDKMNRIPLATAIQPSVHCLKKLTVDMFSSR